MHRTCPAARLELATPLGWEGSAMRRVRTYLPSTPEAAEYAGLNSPDPVPPLAGHEAGRRPRRLTLKQRANFPFLGYAVERVEEEARSRAGRWLRRLDTIHRSGCRTKQQRWDALAAVIETMLARMDIATLCLGWLDDDGAFRLNRQKGLAEDSGLAPWRVSRLLSALERAKYTKRKYRRVYQNGRKWITRVTIHLRPQFFIDLGLAHELSQARSKKKKERLEKLLEIANRKQAQALHELAEKQRRKESHRRAQGARRAAEEEAARAAKIAASIARNYAWSRFQQENPHLSDSEKIAAFNKLHPPPT